MARVAGKSPRRRAAKIRAGDQVRVIAGKDRGKNGRVLRVEPAKQRLYVEGLNMVKHHVRPKAAERGSLTPGTQGQLAGVIEREGSIHISNVMLLDPKGSQPTRVRIDRSGGSRSRIAIGSGTAID